ncbi:hypothetical protein GCM10023259_079660 [Thermocatellispora tengchongensis]
MWAVGLMAVLMAATMVIVYVGMARVARHRGQSAADLSALAAASRALQGQEPACTAASEVATANGAQLERCTINEDATADVWVSFPFTAPAAATGVTRRPHYHARAGPVSPPIHPTPSGQTP